MSFTKEQNLAINLKDKNILVSASAGSGKTTVLVERVLKLILQDKINIDEFLIVTFTNAAASEMKQRIIQKINKEIEKNTANNFLKEQLIRIDRANICTIDSFCLNVVKNNFKIVNIDPIFRIGEQSEISTLTLEVLEEFLEIKYKENKDKFINIVEAFSKKTDDKSFIEIFLKIYYQSENNPFPEKWLENLPNNFNIKSKKDFFDSNLSKNILENLIMYIEEILEIEKIIKTSLIGVNEDSLNEFLKEEFSTYKVILEYAKLNNYEKVLLEFSNLKFKTWKRTFLKDNVVLKEEIKHLRDICKSVISDIKTSFFLKSIEDIINENKIIFPIVKSLCELIIEFNEYFLNIKKTKKIFTFSDISHFCLNILIDKEKNLASSIADEYRKKFKEIIIDEYQDSNKIQEQILSSISKNNMFMVGDIKQCIYRFRQADPKIFNEKYIGYKNGSLNGKRIDLNANFRSNKNIIDGINFYFEKVMSENFGQVRYDDSAKLHIGIKDKNENLEEKTCELCIINTSDEKEHENEDFTNEDFENAEIEANFVAQKILKLKENKDLNFKDIVILMRNSSSIEIFNKVLNKYNIPTFSSSSNSFFEFIEISTILNILKILDNPMQNMPLFGIMNSPIFNFSANEILEIKLKSKSEYLYKSILNYINNYENDLTLKLNKFLNKIENWTSLSKILSINELISYIYENSNYYIYVGLLKNGNIRQANLSILLEKAINFEENNLRGLFNFISYIEKTKDFNKDGEANVFSEYEDVVRIMTIHKSKGLEFPVVFLCNLNKDFNQTDSKSHILFNEDLLGISIFAKEIESLDLFQPRYIISSIEKELVKENIKFNSFSEELRILYVAFTRAKERLILSGCISKDFDKKLENYKNLIFSTSGKTSNKFLPKIFIKSSNNYLAWVYSILNAYCENSPWEVQYEYKQSILKNSKNCAITLEKENIQGENYLNFLYKELENKDLNKTNIEDILNWEYKNELEKSLSTTLSVSEIKRNFQKSFLANEKNDDFFDEAKYNLPKFYLQEEENISSLKKGSIYHLVFEHLNLNFKSKIEIENYLKNLIEKGLLTNKDFEFINIDKILDFLNSDLCKRIKNSKHVKKEVPFRIGLHPSEIYLENELKNSESLVLVNGIIDLYFEEENYIVLVDYKTDKVKNDLKLKERYKIQLDIYKKALEKTTNKKVKECIIYLINYGKVISI